MFGAHETRTQIVLWNLGTVFAVILAAIIFMMLAWRAAAAARIDGEQRQAGEMLSESRALCEKWGLAAGTPRFIECLTDVQTVRDHQAERIRQNDAPL